MKISCFTTPFSFSTSIWSTTRVWFHYLERYGHLKTPPLTSHVWHKKHSCFVAHQNSSSLFTHLECINCLDALQGTSLTNVQHKKFIEQVEMGTLVFFAYFSFTYPPVEPVFPVTCQIWMPSVTTNIKRELWLSLWWIAQPLFCSILSVERGLSRYSLIPDTFKASTVGDQIVSPDLKFWTQPTTKSFPSLSHSYLAETLEIKHQPKPTSA